MDFDQNKIPEPNYKLIEEISPELQELCALFPYWVSSPPMGIMDNDWEVDDYERGIEAPPINIRSLRFKYAMEVEEGAVDFAPPLEFDTFKEIARKNKGALMFFPGDDDAYGKFSAKVRYLEDNEEQVEEFNYAGYVAHIRFEDEMSRDNALKELEAIFTDLPLDKGQYPEASKEELFLV
jgi:hypothetical protein